MRKDIKELFWNFVKNLSKLKNFDYYLYKDFATKENNLSNNIMIEEVYTRKIANRIIFLHYLETTLQIGKIRAQRFEIKKLSRDIYYFGYTPSSRFIRKIIVQNLDNIPWKSKDRIFNYMSEAFRFKKFDNVINHNIVNKKAIIVDSRLFHRVNFLSERINNWTLCSIFLWRSIANGHAKNLNSSRQILHVYGIYKWGKRSLNVELRFGRKLMPEESKKIKNKNNLSLSRNNKKREYSVIVRMGKMTQKDRVDYKRKMDMILAETIRKLKYYSPFE